MSEFQTRIQWALVAAVLAAGIPRVVSAEVLVGRVVGVTDGDTLTLLDANKRQHRIRLAGIDAPEKGQAFGERSKENLSRLAFDRQVDAHCHKRDRYGREVCKVMRGGTDVNLEQIRAGFAWWYREYAKEQSAEDRANYADAEAQARRMGLGLWQHTEPAPPWKWRDSRNNRR